MTDEELVARAQDLIAAWNHRDVDRIVSAFSVEVRFRDVRSPLQLTGREAVRADAEALLAAYHDLELEVRHTVARGNVVTQEWIARATDPRVGQRVERLVRTVADYDGAGRISSYVRYWQAEPALAPEPTQL